MFIFCSVDLIMEPKTITNLCNPIAQSNKHPPSVVINNDNIFSYYYIRVPSRPSAFLSFPIDADVARQMNTTSIEQGTNKRRQLLIAAVC
jgi:hypothetical protein